MELEVEVDVEALAQEAMVLEVLEPAVWVDTDLVDKQLDPGSLLNQVMAHRWVELAIDQVQFCTHAYWLKTLIISSATTWWVTIK